MPRGRFFKDKTPLRRNDRKSNMFPKGGRIKRCRLCHERVEHLDYKDMAILQRLCTGQSKIASRKRSGTCARHQRMVQRAIKQARIMALLPFVS